TPAPGAVAAKVDAALTAGKDKNALPALADDATFLRRATIHLTGKIPAPHEAQAVPQDASPHQPPRPRRNLLASEAYAVNWGRYWRDVLTYHTPASSNYMRWQLFDRWLMDQVKKDRTWSDIVTALVTASGVNDEDAPVNFLTSHFGNPIEIAA